MKFSLLLLIFCASISPSWAQVPTTQEKLFVNALNKLVKNTAQDHWNFEYPMKVDSAFRLLGDTLTVTWKYDTDSSWYRVRMSAPIRGIKEVAWDLYLVLVYDEKLVSVYMKTDKDDAWQLVERRNLFHIGAVSEENRKQMKMKKAIEGTFARIKQ